MKKEKKELIKNFKVVIEDLLDNYEEYTEEEKAQIKEIFQKVADLNAILDKNYYCWCKESHLYRCCYKEGFRICSRDQHSFRCWSDH